METTTFINSADHGIERVTVYQCDRAAIQRRFTVDFKAGLNDIIIGHLPSLLESDSIRVEVETPSEKQVLTVFDVIYSPPNPQNTERDAKVAELEKLRTALEARRYVCKDQVAVLSSYSSSLSGKDTPAADLLGFLDTYASKRHEIQAESTRLKEEIEKVNKELSSVIQSGINVNADAKRAALVKVVVFANKETSGEMVLSYLVPNAGWHSVYDLRVDVDSSLGSKSEASAITLQYRASIHQQTSEDWKGVALTLSTASPLMGSTIPVLTPRYISFGRRWGNAANFGSAFFGSSSRGSASGAFGAVHSGPPGGGRLGVPVSGIMSSAVPSPGQPDVSVFGAAGLPMAHSLSRSSSTSSIEGPQQGVRRHRPRNYSRSRSRSRSRSPSTSRLTVVNQHPSPDFQQIAFKSTSRVATPSQGTISSNFEIEGLSTIPSDDSYHRVSVATLDLTASLEWVCVPRTTPSAFLQCQVKNTSNYMLLAGASNIFMDGNFVAKSLFPDVSPQETFSCSLGVDHSIRVTYPPTTRVARKTGGLMSAKSEVTTFSQRISIKNTRSRALPRLIVKDQVPISQDSRLRVSIVQPSEKEIGSPTNPPSYSLAPSSSKISNDTSSSKTLVAQISKSVIARWAQKYEEGGGWGGPKGDGVMEWICSEMVGTLDLDLIHEVSAPQDEYWS